jgi:hypothetical protein
MGAAASIESMKPVDASDVRSSGDLTYARGEVVQLRKNLGKAAVVYDASDLCRGVDLTEDFDRCVSEIAHIRQCLRLSTQGARRATRHVLGNISGEIIHRHPLEQKSDDESSSDSDDER